MNKLLFSIFFLTIFYSFAGWEKIEGLKKEAQINTVHFSDSLNGWVCGIIKAPPLVNGYLASTNDGGLTWREIVTKFQFETINGVFFQNKDTGWIAAQDQSKRGIFTKTINHGSSWSVVLNDSLYYGINKVLFPTKKIGYLSFWGKDLLAKSTDYGDSWSILPFDRNYNDMCFLNQDTGWIVGEFGGGTEGLISKTEDGGKTWIQKNPKDGKNLKLPLLLKAFFVDKNHGWVGGRYNTIATTNDGGDNWYIQNDSLISDDIICGIHFFNHTVGWAISFGGRVYFTEDGGNDWNEKSLGDSIKYLNNIFFADSRHGWIVGDNGILFRTTDNGGHPLAVQEIFRKVKSDNLAMEAITAAPGNTIGLKFTIAFPGRTSLTLYNFSGKKVASAVNRWQDKGSYQFFFNAPPGAYLVRFSVQRGNETDCLSKKIVWACN